MNEQTGSAKYSHSMSPCQEIKLSARGKGAHQILTAENSHRFFLGTSKVLNFHSLKKDSTYRKEKYEK
jgi:hypothetical protein